MASKRLLTRFTTTPTRIAARPFSSTPWPQRSPALSDVEPGNVESFDKKQQQFRAELSQKVKAQKEKDRQQQSPPTSSAAKSSSASTSTLDATSASAPMNSHGTLEGGGLGSLSTAETGKTQQDQDEANNKKKPGSGRLSSLIYGTEEGREMDREIERSFSQVLARGKYVHSIVFHEVKPDKVDEYVELVSGWYPRMAGMPENKVNLVGSWRTEVGDCDTFGRVRRLSRSVYAC